ncbi:helix-turn-helix domain-containing protein [Streptomyces sp. NPDC052301]|uniref:AraC-like ligand-binding domain-containing protein n=1 Tax=Streptomyces sp. NPDC052301 TaxID=3365687 RepID=UPI0037D430D2
MPTTVLDTAQLPPAERRAAWSETTEAALMPTRTSFADGSGMRARIQTMTCGPVQLSELSYTPLTSRRTPRLIRRGDPELYQLAWIVSGGQGMEQAGHRTALGPDDLVFYDSSRPFEAMVGPRPDGDDARSLVLQFPRRLLPLREQIVAPQCGRAFSGRSGLGRLLCQMLTGLAETHADLTLQDGSRIGATAIELVAALLAHHGGAQSALPAESRQRVLFEQIGDFIDAHLNDPDLTPASIAAAHFVSTRYLHRVFHDQGTTVCAFVRRQRLAQCRRELADPARQNVPIHAIGARWGFPRASDFTRAFRATMGMTPSEYRAAYLASARPPGDGRLRS